MIIKRSSYLCGIIICVNLVMISAFFTTYLSRRIEEAKNLSSIIKTMEVRIDVMNENLLNFDRNEEELAKNNYKSEVRPIYFHEETDALFYLLDTTKEYNLEQERFKIFDRIEGQTEVKRPIELIVVGQYSQAMNFLAYIQSGKYYFFPERVMFNATRVINEGDVVLTLHLSLFLEEEKDAADTEGDEYRNERSENPFYYP